MKKITLMHYAYPPHIGGVEKVIREHALILSKFGYEVTVLTGSGKEEKQIITLMENPLLEATLGSHPQLQSSLLSGHIPQDFQNFQQRIEILLEKQLADQNVVIVHNMLTLVHNLPFVAAFKTWRHKHPKVNVIVWVHDQTYIDAGRVIWKKEGVRLHPKMKKLLLDPIENTTYVVISETLRRLLLEVMPLSSSHTFVVPNGVMTKRFLEINPVIADFLAHSRMFQAFPVILVPSNILKRKNIEYAISVVAELKKKFPLIRLIISGLPSLHRKNDKYLQDIKKLVERKKLIKEVFFFGEIVNRALEDKELHDLYQIADLIFFFSKQENFGLPILEAALTKTPIVVSDLEVFHELGEDLLHYSPLNQPPKRLAQKISSDIKTNKTLQMYYHVRKEFDMETIVKNKIVPLIERVQ